MGKSKNNHTFAELSKGSSKKPSETSSQYLSNSKQALELIKKGHLKEAELIYRELIASGHQNYLLYENLAALFAKRGKKNERIELLKSLLKIKPNYPVGHFNLGNALQEKGDINAAISSYQQALKLKPNYPEAHSNQGIAYKKKGDFNSAISSFQQALKLKSNYPEAYNNLGNALREKGDFNSAISSFQQALKLKPAFPEAYYNLGLVYQQKGDINAAISSYQQALKLKPNYPEAIRHEGIAYYEKGDFNSAISSFQQALKLKPNFPKALNSLGNALQEKGDINAAILSFQQALKLKRNYPEAHNNFGNALQEKGDFDSAISSFQQALKLKPAFPEAYYNLGNTLHEKGDLNDAIFSFQQALKLKSNYPDAHNNLGHVFLLNGQYECGWLEYEYRSKKTNQPSIPHAQPTTIQWHGEKYYEGDKLLIISEQGLGDTIQYMRYIPLLVEKGLDVSFCAQTKLHNLIKTSGVNPNPLSPKQANLISEGKWMPLLSLPRYLGITPENPLIYKPYISTTERLISQWRHILSKEKLPIIGINWQGNQNAEKYNLKGRSLLLETFSSLAKMTNFKLLSLQKGFGSEQLENCSFREKFVGCQKQINSTWDFLENAAIIANCNLIITSDTAVAHLAGGMGKKVWLLLKDVPFWTWGMHSDKTFWYPSMRLFRQKERNNWHEVIARVSIELKKEMEEKV